MCLGGERIWMMQRRSARKQAEDLSRDQGADAAVDWAMANATKMIHVDVLQQMLGNLFGTGTLDADFFRRELASTFRKWK